MIIDTHAHLDDKRFKEDLEEVIESAKRSGVDKVLIPGADMDDLEYAQEIANSYENIYFAAGVHPYHHNQYNEKRLREFLEDEKCIAIGECGLDYYRLPEGEDEKVAEKMAQQEVFKAQIRLARSVHKPIIVHIRDASDDSKKMLVENEAKEVGGVLHCYNANEHLLSLASDGFYFGIGGVLTFKNAKKLVEVLPQIPLEKLLVETDAPYLSPHPHRGKRNEPAFTKFVVEKIADILEKEIKEIENLTTNNAKKLFKAFAK